MTKLQPAQICNLNHLFIYTRTYLLWSGAITFVQKWYHKKNEKIPGVGMYLGCGVSYEVWEHVVQGEQEALVETHVELLDHTLQVSVNHHHINCH